MSFDENDDENEMPSINICHGNVYLGEEEKMSEKKVISKDEYNRLLRRINIKCELPLGVTIDILNHLYEVEGMHESRRD